MERLPFRSVLRAPHALQTTILRTASPLLRQPSVRYASAAPTVAQTSFWKSLIPKPLRRSDKSGNESTSGKTKVKSKDWNPATFFIFMFLFIGSMSIQMIALKQDFNTFMRRAEVRIGLLREVVEKLQKGEQVDVEKVLGTGDADKEAAWEELIRKIERDDVQRNTKEAQESRKSPTSRVVPEAATYPTSTQIAESTKPKTGSYADFF
ncbi:hypothetical protein F5Y15DRAFT_325855 [Xylariaceae sp. FL0016]|nr:hypothetical protein F5Y15DRAFT_325855 [Xylariaceae sp. FL0016]